MEHWIAWIREFLPIPDFFNTHNLIMLIDQFRLSDAQHARAPQTSAPMFGRVISHHHLEKIDGIATAYKAEDVKLDELCWSTGLLGPGTNPA